MGQCSSDAFPDFHFKEVYSTFPFLLKWKPEFESLSLRTIDIGRLYYIFRKIDRDNGGRIEVLELLMFLDVERTPFTKRAFTIFDEDGSGSVDFREYVLSMWNYCTLDSSTLCIFAFDIYDRDMSGFIDCKEVRL